MEISKFINKKTGEENQMSHFNILAPKTKSKEELRILEMHLLKPKPLPIYKGAKSGQSEFQKCSLLFMFPQSSCIDRIGQIFSVNKYITNNIYSTEWVMELIALLESKKIKWNKDKKKFYRVSRSGKRVML